MTTAMLAAARAGALFCAPLHAGPVDKTTATAAIRAQIRAYGSRGCACRVAEEYGDHPDTAAARMKWAVSVVSSLYNR